MSEVSAGRGRALLSVLAVCLLCGAVWGPVYAQQPNSPVFRNYRPPQNLPPIFQPDLRRHWNDFMLVRDANAGDAEAQHELGMRYLFGNRFPADTARAVMWIARAAEQGLVTASYNYGLLLNNGWGVEWNPREAFRYFLAAAEKGMPEAEHVVGLFYTDNLLLPRDWVAAYRWMRRSADRGFAPAKETLEELRKGGYVTVIDSATVVEGKTARTQGEEDERDGAGSTAWSPIFLDVGSDTGRYKPDDFALLVAAIVTSRTSAADSLRLATRLRSGKLDSADLAPIFTSAAYCNPDALVFLGRLREGGLALPADRIAACISYARASYLDSPVALRLLVNALEEKSFQSLFEARVKRGDADALLLYAALGGLNLRRRFFSTESSEQLQRLASGGDARALLLLGILKAGGGSGERDIEEALRLWTAADSLGLLEGRLRRVSGLALLEGTDYLPEEDVSLLREAVREGSTLAEVTMALLHEKGLSVKRNVGEAVRLYRSAAQRGSANAYRALVRLYKKRQY